MLEAAGWVVQDYKAVNLYAGTGRGGAGAGHQRRAGRLRAVREPPGGRGDRGEEEGHDPLGRRVADGQVPGQRARRPARLPRSTAGCPYGYESTGDETWFTCRMDPEPTARRVFWFHRPETLERQIEDHVNHGGGTLRARIPDMPDARARPGPAARRPVRGDHQPGAVAEGQPLRGR